MSFKEKEHIKEQLCSVIMPLYNSEKYIKEAVLSVLEQTYKNLELIIIDDCSTDDSKKIVNKLSLVDKRIKTVFLTENKGCADARNIGLTMSQGQYVAFIDSDDIWEKEKLEKQINVLENNNVDISFTAYKIINENKVLIKNRAIKKEIKYTDLLKENSVAFSTVICKKNKLSKIQFKKEWFHEDYVFLLDLLKNKCRAQGANTILVSYRLHSQGRSFNKFNAAKYRWKIYRYYLNLSLIESILLYFLHS